ncbi:hypothetical protein C0J52_05917 [Blattella germanica]|nr:hypothetical protein C0J52_05917 [Blattella germanica]
MAGSILKFKNEGKLHICRGPGLKSWCMLIGLITIGLLIAGYLTDSMIGKLFSLLICLVLGLIFLDEWEDCVMDLYKNKVILIRSNWYDRLFCRVPEENTRILSLNNIIGIQFLEQGLSFLLSTGSLVPVTKHSLTYRSSINYTQF